MFKKFILAISLITLVFSFAIAQNIQSVHQLTQSCYVGINGKLVVNAGGHYITSVSEQVFLRDSLLGSIYDTVNNSFKNNKKTSFTYDAGGLLTASESKTLDKNGVSWSNSLKIGYQYTGFQLFEEVFKSWDKTLTDWTNYLRNIYSYETDNSLSSIFYQNWDSDSLEWKYVTRDLVSYNLNKNVTSVENQKWNKSLVSWDNYQKVNFTYTGGYISEKVYQIWNKSTLLWDDYQKETFTYANNNKAEVILQLKSGTSWVNSVRNVFVFGNSGVSEITEYFWSDSWKENRKFIYTYNANNMETSVVTQQWAAHLNSFRNQLQDESFYTQREVYGIDESPANSYTITNPISKRLPFLIGGLKEHTKYQVNLISLNGSLVQCTSIAAGETISLNNQLTSGIYLLSISESGKKGSFYKVLVTE